MKEEVPGNTLPRDGRPNPLREGIRNDSCAVDRHKPQGFLERVPMVKKNKSEDLRAE